MAADKIVIKAAKNNDHQVVILVIASHEASEYGLSKALLKAVKKNNYNIVNTLSDHVSDLNPALIKASAKGRLPIVKLLVDKGASDLDSALLKASKHDRAKVAEYLLKQGASNRRKALIVAMKENNSKVAEVLI